MKKTVALYCRVSTDSQSVDSQKQDLLHYCEAQGWEPTVYEDVGISGAEKDRPALSKMMDACNKGKHSVVLVHCFSRFARNTEHLLSALETFRSLGIDFVSLTEGISTIGPMGKLVFTFLAAIHEFQLSIIHEKVCSGIRAAQARGVHCGRPRAGFDVAKAINLKQQGWGVRRIAKEVGVSHTTVHRVLKSISGIETYVGQEEDCPQNSREIELEAE